MPALDGALQLWREIVRSLHAAGYAQIIPEYQRLSELLRQTRITAALQGEPETEQWRELRQLASQALEMIGPLANAARILAELPTAVEVAPPPPPPAKSNPIPRVKQSSKGKSAPKPSKRRQ